VTETAWTDWIKHTPGQELLPGTYVRMEMLGSDLIPVVREGMVTSEFKGHPCWYATTPYGRAKMITRYKIRLDADLNEEEVNERLPEIA